MRDKPAVLSLVLVALVWGMAITFWLKPCQPQPVIHCLDGFYRYADTKNGIEHIYCLRKKYEPPTKQEEPQDE